MAEYITVVDKYIFFSANQKEWIFSSALLETLKAADLDWKRRP